MLALIHDQIKNMYLSHCYLLDDLEYSRIDSNVFIPITKDKNGELRMEHDFAIAISIRLYQSI